MTAPTDCWLTLTARDPRRLIDFLQDAFGFVELVVHGEGDQIEHAELATPGGRGGVMLGSVRQGDDRGVTAPGQASAYVVVTDVDGLFARATAAGATVLRAPFDTDYGSRDCAFADPERNSWFFGSYPGTSAG